MGYSINQPAPHNALGPQGVGAYWSPALQFIFRVAAIYFTLQCIPLDARFYRFLFSINWLHLQFSDVFALARYTPRFFSSTESYADWGIIFLIALVAALGWSYADRQRTKPYNEVFYWVRALVRYRLAIAVIAYGFIKFFPIQAPYPSISHLNTNYGDFTRWKLFSLSLGIVPGYESFLGAVEIIMGLLLLYRRTASIGAFIVIIFTGNVFMSNLAYEGGDQVYSLFLITLALFVLLYDAQRLANLLVFQKPATPVLYRPTLNSNWKRYGRLALKTAFILFFVVVYGWQTAAAYSKGAYRYPQQPGLAGSTGVYNVSSFHLNKDSIGYAPDHPLRWQDLVFENWNTISIRSNRPLTIDSNNIERIAPDPSARAYEQEGTAARQYYSYTADTAQHTLVLQNKNKYAHRDQWVLHYAYTADSALQLWGNNLQKDSVNVVLNKIKKKYLLQEVARRGRQQPIKL